MGVGQGGETLHVDQWDPGGVGQIRSMMYGSHARVGGGLHTILPFAIGAS